jgi:2-oxoglutarate ferredoxin oxidoreductase subunit alpha
VTKVKGVAFLADEVEDIIDAALDGSLAEIESNKTKFAKLDGSEWISKRDLVHD